jgi:hypothetical protein
LWLAAREVPSWHIAPARTGNVRDLVAGADLVTFSNSSPAWGFNSSGVLVQPTPNVPFIEYDPATGACLGWRVWDGVTNLVVRSEEFDDASWGKTASGTGIAPVVTPNATVAPDGATTADRVVFSLNGGTTSSDQSNLLTNSIARTNGTTYTFSLWIKSADSSTYTLRLNIVSGAGETVTAEPGAWKRVFVTRTSTLDQSTSAIIRLRGGQSTSNTADVYVWGAQLNTGALAPYVPTTSLTASSTADVGDLLSWALANNIRGAYIRGRTTASGTRGLLSGNDNSSSNRIEAITSGTDPRLQVTSSGSSVADINGGTIAASTPFRMAMRFDTDSYALSVNGGAVAIDTSGARPTIDRWFLGRTQAGGYGNCYLEELALFSGAPADARLIAMAGA